MLSLAIACTTLFVALEFRVHLVKAVHPRQPSPTGTMCFGMLRQHSRGELCAEACIETRSVHIHICVICINMYMLKQTLCCALAWLCFLQLGLIILSTT